ncbi:2-keto-3-deoxygalactonate kinase [Gemmobacter aquatilis]|uniref:2-keto-3-deoxygalactonate kinase n=1 Tax=Gemmobacter aquatilis TaxID=933059 RepID=A0A1H7YBD2_9RHOB|nr:2-dehydro-3-deoxygalactonokinase [Gemmobacter aquatilis]SEM43275.1 2-keto-3-deoxygalactonate kinase [Gemmobacter aquatilis]
MTPDWIAADWGTSALRVWAMRGDSVLAEAQSADGMGRLGQDGFEPALLRLIGGWLTGAPLPVIACGMVGARQGWSEAAYRAVPCPPLGLPFHRVEPADPRFTLHILPGLSQTTPPDVMRGEETQIAGFLQGRPVFEGTLCLPGTHTKWVHVRAGKVARFQTCMTGELFALLSGQSVLRHGLDEGWDDTAFTTAVAEAAANPARLGTDLFAIRARGLLGSFAPGAARARLSGLLIGLELAATCAIWQGGPVVLIGAGGLSRHYAIALSTLNCTAEVTDGTEITLAGLCAAHRLLKEAAT